MSKAKQAKGLAATKLPIHSTAKNHVFLTIHQQGEMAHVQRTELGRLQLPKFWTVWLKVMVEEDLKPQFAAKPQVVGDSVVVGPGRLRPSVMAEMVAGIACEIRPLAYSALKSVGHSPETAHKLVRWKSEYPDYTPNLGSLKQMLPASASLTFEDGEVVLEYRGANPSLYDVAMLVELQASLDFKGPVKAEGDDHQLAS